MGEIITSTCDENLTKIVLEKSSSDSWEKAVIEWKIVDCIEDDKCNGSCVCGQEHLHYLYKLHNATTGNYLYPIGSSCIKKFGDKYLADEASTLKDMFKLLQTLFRRSIKK